MKIDSISSAPAGLDRCGKMTCILVSAMLPHSNEYGLFN
jgi:hypothetical protein